MKKAFIILSSGILLMSSVTFISCGGGDSSSSDEKKDTTPVVAEEPANPAAMEGLELIGKSDCLTCHKVNEPAIGPAYVAVSERYKGNQASQDSLVAKIIKGGSGKWGAAMMTPHPNIPEADAKKMITYIMSLKPE